MGLRHLGKGGRLQPVVLDERPARAAGGIAGAEKRRRNTKRFLPPTVQSPAGVRTGVRRPQFPPFTDRARDQQAGSLGGSVGTAPRGSGVRGGHTQTPCPGSGGWLTAEPLNPLPVQSPASCGPRTVLEGLGVLLLFLFINFLQFCPFCAGTSHFPPLRQVIKSEATGAAVSAQEPGRQNQRTRN